jgi:hypothetical protein
MNIMYGLYLNYWILKMGRDPLTRVILTMDLQINMKKILKIEKPYKYVLLIIDLW